MKIAILGGGVAGLAFGIYMKKNGHEVLLFERSPELPVLGNAFLMHREGMEILEELDSTKSLNIGATIHDFTLRRPDETLVQRSDIDSWQCIKRRELIELLASNFGIEHIQFNRCFSHFEWKDEVAQKAVFEDGSFVEADMFVGSDGCHSNVRKALFGETVFTPVEVQEILGLIRDPHLVELFKGHFTKYQDSIQGLSFGFIPTSDHEIVWYNQFDVKLTEGMVGYEKELKKTSTQLLSEFPELVQQLIKATDEQNMYLWNTKDFDLLSSFHRGNVVLMGDAAHVALPFTSAGTTNALYDARQLAHELEVGNNIRLSFNRYYEQRAEMIREHISLGRQLKQAFLFPEQNNGSEIPLVRFNNTVSKKVPVKKTNIEVLYFTDPICSTCWTFQPELRRFKNTYADKIDFRYVMGGLLPSWKEFDRGGIRNPEDVYHHWKEVSEKSGVPIHPEVWLTDPLHSSYPASIAYKAAELQDPEKAVIFLRRLQELVFLERTNIARVEILHRLAMSVGLDDSLFLEDIKGRAIGQFLKDLSLIRDQSIRMLPTLIFKKDDSAWIRMNGPQSFEAMEHALNDMIHWPSQQQVIINPMDQLNAPGIVLPGSINVLGATG